MSKNSRMRMSIASGVVTAATFAVLGMAGPSHASGVESTTGTTASQAAAKDVGAAASWRTIDTFKTPVGCAGQKAALELNTNWQLRCSMAGPLTFNLQRYY